MFLNVYTPSSNGLISNTTFTAGNGHVITRTRVIQERNGKRYERWKHTLSDSDVIKVIEILNRDNKSFIEAQF